MKGWICALFIILACAQPTSSRAYFKYVPPQPPAKRYVIVKTLEAVVVSRYIKPERKYYKSKKAYFDAIKLNGKGKKTFFGTPPRADFTIAANQGIKPGSKPGKFKRGTIVKIKLDDGTSLIGKVDDRCVAAENLWRENKTIQFDIFSKMSQKQADDWGKRKMTVEILREI